MANYYYDEYGYDYLKALISECHKEGIEVHAWVELLRVKNPSGEMHDYINPNWIVSDLNGDTSACFLDPSNPDVETFLLNIISEILTNYDFDGISYDYVRYTESGNFNGYQDSGFSQNAEEDFLEQYAYDVDDLPVAVKTDNDIREDWQEFKRSSLSSLIKNISSHIKSINSDVIISVSHYGAIEGAREIYMQDVEFWCENGYIDVILPMIYSTDTFYYTETVKSFNGLNDTVLQYPGIYSLYNGNSIRTTVELIDNSALYSFGNSIFASQNVFTNTDNIIDTLTTTTHKGRAVSPTSDVNAVFDAWKKQISDRTNRIYKNYLTVLEYEIIMEFCQNSSERLNCPQNTADLLKKLEMLRTSVEAIENEAAKARLIEQIDYIYKVLDLSITRSINRQQIIDNQIFH